MRWTKSKFLKDFWGGVYMTPGRLSRRDEFTPVPSHGSTFVYMIPPQKVMPARVAPAWVHSGCRTGARISLQYEISQRYHVNTNDHPFRCEIGLMFAILNHTCILSTWSVPSNNEIICEITQSSCKRDTKSKSHVGMKLAPVRVFSCKHHLTWTWLLVIVWRSTRVLIPVQEPQSLA